MPCDLAVTITKASLSEERARALLDLATISPAVLAFLQKQYATESVRQLPTSGSELRYRFGPMVLTIGEGGEVTVTDRWGEEPQRCEQLATDVSALLGAAADRLFQQRVQQALAPVTTQAQRVTVENEGTRQQAAVFYLNL